MTETVLPLNLLSCISTVDVGWVQYGDARGEAPCKKKLRILPLPGGKGVGGMGIKIKYTIGKAGTESVCYLNCNVPATSNEQNHAEIIFCLELKDNFNA